ncbi:MAG: hypothetical protein ACKOFG_01770, partial [Limnohabitans sp.]
MNLHCLHRSHPSWAKALALALALALQLLDKVRRVAGGRGRQKAAVPAAGRPARLATAARPTQRRAQAVA